MGSRWALAAGERWDVGLCSGKWIVVLVGRWGSREKVGSPSIGKTSHRSPVGKWEVGLNRIVYVVDGQ